MQHAIGSLFFEALQEELGRTRTLWIMRLARWMVLPWLLLQLTPGDSHARGAAALAVMLGGFGEVRSWTASRRGYHSKLQGMLNASVLSTTVLASCFSLYRDVLVHHHLHAMLYLITTFVPFYLLCGLVSEIVFRFGLAEMVRLNAGRLPPPLSAEFLLYLALPRRNRESLLGCLNEDFTTEVLPKFGPFLAAAWYWWKTILFVSMYACANAVEPLIRNVIEPSGAESRCRC